MVFLVGGWVCVGFLVGFGFGFGCGVGLGFSRVYWI